MTISYSSWPLLSLIFINLLSGLMFLVIHFSEAQKREQIHTLQTEHRTFFLILPALLETVTLSCIPFFNGPCPVTS